MIVDDTTNPAVPMTHARIGYDKIFGTITASSEANGFPATAADNPLTYTGWKPTALPATWQIDAGTAQDVDYVGIAAHTLGSSFCKVKVQYSDNGSDWLDASSPHRPNDDSPILFLFDEQEARYWRIYVNSTNLLLWSEAFDNAVWVKSGVSVNPADDIVVNGIKLHKVVGNGSNFTFLWQEFGEVAPGQVVTFSAYTKQGGAARTAIRFWDNQTPTAHQQSQQIEWVDGVPSFGTSSQSSQLTRLARTIEPVGDGVYRIALTIRNDTGGPVTLRASMYERWDIAPVAGEFTYWGAAQVEEGFPTSYIKTEGSTSPSDIPFVGVIYIGKALAMQRAIYGGHSPVTLSRETTIRPTVSERGQWLGRSIIRGGLVGSWTWRHLNADWYREHFDRFVKAARERPFFIAWRPETFPNEVAYCWTQKDIVPSNMGIKDFMQVTVEAVGVE